MERKPVSVTFSEATRRLLFLCASLSPALAGLPHLMEYVWIHLLSTWRPGSE